MPAMSSGSAMSSTAMIRPPSIKASRVPQARPLNWRATAAAPSRFAGAPAHQAFGSVRKTT